MRLKPVTETEETVTLRRLDYEALLNAAEDVADMASVAAHRAHEEQVGWEAARQGYLTWQEAERLLVGQSPVRIWREKHGLSQRALADRAHPSLRKPRRKGNI